MTIIEKARIAAEIKAFENTDFSDCPEMTDEQLAQLRPSHYRNMANYNPIKKTVTRPTGRQQSAFYHLI